MAIILEHSVVKMNRKHMLLLASSGGGCVGVGSELASGQSVSTWGAPGSSMEDDTGEQIFKQLMKLGVVMNGLPHELNIFQLQEVKSPGKDTVVKKDSEDAPPTSVVKKDSEDAPPTSVVKKDSENTPSAKEVPSDNEFEKRLRPEVIPANEIGVTLDDIGALDEIKKLLHELVILPLESPELFIGNLCRPCKGILLFGPPGTGKTMLAKAIANEAGASFINVSMSTITSKWFGEDEKTVRALFTLAAKVSPTIIFVDEVDCMLGERTRAGEHEASRKIKNEFMTQWDGLMEKSGERILVLAATNRPFDLDEAIIRRFQHRIMVGLPSVKDREMIFKILLSKEKAEDLNFKGLAAMTEGYTGSDLQNLCRAAAVRPVLELAQKKGMMDTVGNKRKAAGKSSEDVLDSKGKGKEEQAIELRTLNMEDLREAKNRVAASVSAEGEGMSKLRQWNEIYGDGGSRKKQLLTYYV